MISIIASYPCMAAQTGQRSDEQLLYGLLQGQDLGLQLGALINGDRTGYD